MKKTAVVYWSSTGNTEAMAQAVLEGMKEAGAEAVLLTPDAVDVSALAGMDAIAFGCPAMGSEVLEECEFEPMFSGCKNRLGGKSVGLFGSYGWGDGQWMRDWRRTVTTQASSWCARASSAARRRTTPYWRPAGPWARFWRSDFLHVSSAEKPSEHSGAGSGSVPADSGGEAAVTPTSPQT